MARPPARVRAPKVPARPQLPEVGRWLWTCRATFEPHLFEELAWSGAAARVLGPSLVEADGAVATPPAFGRMGFPVGAVVKGLEGEKVAAALLALLGPRRVHLQAWTPDTAAGNTYSAWAQGLCDAVAASLPAGQRLSTAQLAREAGGVLGQLCLVADAEPGPATVLGVVPAASAISLAPGGRLRMWRDGTAPSRAALKLEEAFETWGDEPGKGDVCVDLGAAPGGWTQRLVDRGARVVAVDPGQLTDELAAHPRVRHVQLSAFDFAPDAPVDWLLCDMAWRPLEVAQLLAKWARRGWALRLCANLKLPMKDKNPVLFRVRGTLEAAGWELLGVRQLYHDRDEVTVFARRRR